jgi:hypothetical protein
VDDTYNIFKRDFDDQYAIPKANDLIINKDGRFFKVISYYHIDQEYPFAKCALIAVSGTGGSGGGSIGPSGPSVSKDIKITFEPFNTVFVYGAEYAIKFVAVADYPNLTATYRIYEEI